MASQTNVKIGIDATGAKKGATTFESSAKKINSSVSTMSKKTGALSKSFGGLYSSIAVFAGLSLIFKKIAKDTIEYENVMAQLESVIASTGGTAGFTADELDKVASSLQKVTKFGDESIKSAQSLLLTFKNIKGDQFLETTEIVLDFAQAMGTSAKSAAIQLGKALNDPVRNLSLLSRSGVQFSDSQTEVIKKLATTNRLAEAQTVVLAELRSEFGGSAKAARDTLGGALTNLQNTFSDLSEAVGRAITGESGMKNQIESLNTAIENIIEPVKNVVNFISKASASIINIFVGMANMTTIAYKGIGNIIYEAFKTSFFAIPKIAKSAFYSVLTVAGAFAVSLTEVVRIAFDEAFSGIDDMLGGLSKRLKESNIWGSNKLAFGLDKIKLGFDIVNPKNEIKDIENTLMSLTEKWKGNTKTNVKETGSIFGEGFDKIKNDAINTFKDWKTGLIETYDTQKNIMNETVEKSSENSEKIISNNEKVKEKMKDNSGIDSMIEKAKTFKDVLVESSTSFTESFANSMMEGKLLFDDFFKDILNKLLQLQIEKSITQPLFASLGLSGFASGGRPPTDRISIVGEKGPELFVPDSSGTIIPNNKLSSGSSSVITNVNIINNTSASIETQKTQNSSGGEDITLMIRNAIADDIQNGGAVRETLSNVFGLQAQGV